MPTTNPSNPPNPAPPVVVPDAIEDQTIGCMLPVGELFHDNVYSRPLSESRVASIAAKFDFNALGALYVSLRGDGRYAVLDGCHRHAAAIRVGVKLLPCRVYIDLTIEQEAGLFTIFNRDRRAMKPGEVFRGRLASGDQKAIDIRDVVRSTGFDVGLNGSHDVGRIGAVAAVEAVYTMMGPEMLREVLQLIADTWGTDDNRGHSDVAVRGLSAFLVRYRDHQNFHRARLIDRLQLTGPTTLIANSGAFRKVVYGIDPPQAFGRTVLGVYNKSLREGSQLPEWVARAYSEIAKASIATGRDKANESRKKTHA